MAAGLAYVVHAKAKRKEDQRRARKGESSLSSRFRSYVRHKVDAECTPVREEDEDLVSKLINAMEAGGLDEKEIESYLLDHPLHPTKVVAQFAAEARNHLHLREFNEANYLAAREFIHKAMVKHGMRPTHIASNLDIAVVCAFFRTRGELQARRLRGTIAGSQNVFEQGAPVEGTALHPETMSEVVTNRKVSYHRPASN